MKAEVAELSGSESGYDDFDSDSASSSTPRLASSPPLVGGSRGAGGGGSCSALRRLTTAMKLLSEPVGFFPSGFTEQFERLQRETEPIAAELAAQNDRTRKKNRYFDILPLEETRVKLRLRGLEQGIKPEAGEDYVNASFVDDPVNKGCRRYIAAQAPLPDCVQEWWEMIWDQGSRVILMLTNCTEGTVVKAHMYWPAAVGAKGIVKLGDTSLVLLESRAEGACVKRHISVERLGEETRRVWLLQYVGWPDRAALQHSDFAQLDACLEDMRALAMAQEGPGDLAQPQSPWLVHCSAGVGRTGAVIVIDAIIRAISRLGDSGPATRDAVAKDGTAVLACPVDPFDIFAVAKAVRRQRPGMIMTQVQYEMVYAFVRWWLERRVERELSGAAYRGDGAKGSAKDDAPVEGADRQTSAKAAARQADDGALAHRAGQHGAHDETKRDCDASPG